MKISKDVCTFPKCLQKVSDSEISLHGCRVCVLKSHSLCPHGLSGNDVLDVGYCQEFVNTLASLCDGKVISSSALWEKYNLYILRLQSLEDYKSFIDLDNKIKQLEKDGISSEDLSDLESQRNVYKLWWHKLNMTVLNSLRHIVDRESKLDTDVTKSRISVQQLNVLIDTNASKVLDDNTT